MSDERARKFEEALIEALEGVLITKYVIIAETIDAQGVKTLETATSEDLPIWDEMGMLRFHLTIRDKSVEGQQQ